MYKDIRKKAKQEQDRIANEIGNRLDDEGFGDYSKLIERFEKLETLKKFRSPVEKFTRALIPFLIAVVIVAPAWLFHYPSPEISFNGQVSRIAMGIDTNQTQELGSFNNLDYLRVDGLERMDSDLPIHAFENLEGKGFATIEGPVNVARVVLVPIQNDSITHNLVNPGFSIGQSGNMFSLDMENSDIQVYANVEDFAWLQTIENLKGDSVSNASFEFYGNSEHRQKGLYFGMNGGRTINFPVLHSDSLSLRDIAFNYEGEQESFSSLINGTLSIIDTGRQYEMLRGTSLVLDDLEGNIRLSLEGKKILVTYHGKAGVLGYGKDADNLRLDLRPTIAEWISSDKTVALVWSSLLFVLGLVWTAWRSIWG